MKLIQFKLKDGNEFSVYGTYTIETGKTFNFDTHKLETYEFPEFYELEGKQIVFGEELPFTPNGEAWNGRKYNAEDMICEFYRTGLLGSSVYDVIYLDEGLAKIFNTFKDDFILVKEKPFAKKIFSYDMLDLLELLLVTDEYTYYGSCDQFIMLGTENRMIISDNYFAEVGFSKSVEHIRNGKETLLWGELPEKED